MPHNNALLQQLELAVSEGSAISRRAALSYTTDLLIAGRYTDEDIWMFGEIVGLLASEIEASARAQLSHRLAPCRNAPSNIIHKLASDDSIDVAGPVLRQSEQLSTPALVEHAKFKSQAHLLAISQRKSLHEDVTDVLVTRGNHEVVRSVARNVGARFSESGFWRLVQRSENDIVLALDVGARKDLSRHHFQMLIAKASDEVKARLIAANPNAAAEIQEAVTDVTGAVHERFGPGTRSYFAAKKAVAEMHRTGELTEQKICEFARAGKLEEVTVALSLVCDLPVNVTERALLDDHGEMVLILAKAANLSWTATKLLLCLCREGSVSAHVLDGALKNYSILSVATARKVMGFYRFRKERRGSSSNPS